jgi:hypothetical protein
VSGFPRGSEMDAPPHFFVLKEDPSERYDAQWLKARPVRTGDAARCPACGGIIGMRTWLPPYQGEVEVHGEALGDVISATGDDMIISERLAESFRAEGLTGWGGFHPVDILRVRKGRVRQDMESTPRYFVVNPCFGQGAVDETRSRLRRNKPAECDGCRYAGLDSIHGFVLEQGSWKGEDIFRPRGLQGCVVVSERFAGLVRRHGFTNMELIPTEAYVWDPLGRGPPTPASGAPR